ncbi:MAG: hypothetical protein ACRD5Z_22610 [Bryobacteraceae bacterium]
MNWIAYINKGNSAGLRVFFSLVLILILWSGVYAFRNRNAFFAHRGDEGDSYASANLRMWMVILIWIHAMIISAFMIFEV